MATRESPTSAQLDIIIEKINAIERTSNTPSDSFNLSPLLEELKSSEKSQGQVNEQLAQGLDNISKMTEQIHLSGSELREMVERMEEQVRLLEQRSSDVENTILEVANMQTSLSSAATAIAADLNGLMQQDNKNHEEIQLIMENRVVGGFEEVPNMIQSEVRLLHEDLYKSRKQNDNDFKVILSEIARVQQALNLDFVQVLKDRVEEAVADKVSAFDKTVSQLQHDILEVETKTDAKVGQVEQQAALDMLALQAPAKGKKHGPGGHPKVDKLGSPQASLESARSSIMDNTISGSAITRKRYREMFTQTTPPETDEGFAQTDPIEIAAGEPKRRGHARRARQSVKKNMGGEETQKKQLGSADKLKEQALAAAMERPYDVFDMYYTSGFFQAVAKSSIFENLTLLVVFLNAAWLAVDTDYNDSALIIEADLIFIVAENAFCGYFFIELLIRFMAFEYKVFAFQDAWFVFDFILVSLAVAETWIFTGIVVALDIRASTGGGGSLSVFKMFRLVKLLKLSRLARLLRVVPELVIIMKGIVFATRAVAVFCLLWFIIIYVFAIGLRSVTEGTEASEGNFDNVPQAMNNLLLQGVFPDSATWVKNITATQGDLSPSTLGLWAILIFFFAIVSLVVLYMLVGVLVDVVGVISNVEKERLTVSFVAQAVRDEIEKIGIHSDGMISKFEFEKILVEPSVARVLTQVGVDVSILTDMLDFIFTEEKKRTGMKFNAIVEVILGMRGSNPATVKDCKEQIKVLKHCFNDSLEQSEKRVGVQFEYLIANLKAIREDIQNLQDDSAMGSEAGEELDELESAPFQPGAEG
eukprot:TRINITY_DN4004_c0_g1_i1.p1 TRINITY_DN4004_c0_g1~~TRINITY_DN4004_c0_g1_i1.p1  ORF type:complete len:922 (+),score=169.14 TRINITY_DN4004_c0_g1_i1:324-2768(+)